MKAPRNFTIRISGDTLNVVNRNATDHGRALGYLMDRLLTGFPVADDAFEPFGLTVEVEEG